MERELYSREKFGEVEKELDTINSELEAFEGYYPEELIAFRKAQQEALLVEKEQLLEDAWFEAQKENQAFDESERLEQLTKERERFISNQANIKYIPAGSVARVKNLPGITELLVDRQEENSNQLNIAIVYPTLVSDSSGTKSFNEELAFFSIDTENGVIVDYEQAPTEVTRVAKEKDILSEVSGFLEQIRKKGEVVIYSKVPLDPRSDSDRDRGYPSREGREEQNRNPFTREVIDMMKNLPKFLFRIENAILYVRPNDNMALDFDFKGLKKEYTGYVFEDGILWESHKPSTGMYTTTFTDKLTLEMFKDVVDRHGETSDSTEEGLMSLLYERGYLKETSLSKSERIAQGKRYKYHPRAFVNGRLLTPEEVHANLETYYRNAQKELWGY